MIVVWRVTQNCNLSCPFCGYDRRLTWPRREANPDQLFRFGAVLSDYQRATGNRVLVSWIGGEPLLWPPLTELTVRFGSGFGLSVTTTTNGTPLASSSIRQHLLDHYAELTISVDGIGPVHDELRGWPGGYAALQENVTALAEAKRAAAHGPRLRANVVLMRDTVDKFERLCLELANWGIEEITFNELGGNDRPDFHPGHRLLPEQADWLATVLPGLREHLAKHGVQLDGGKGYLRRIHASTRNERIPIEDCRPGAEFLFINEQGRVAPCSFTAQGYGVPLEGVGSVEAIRRLPHRFTEARRRQRLAPCEDCHSTQVFEKFIA